MKSTASLKTDIMTGGFKHMVHQQIFGSAKQILLSHQIRTASISYNKCIPRRKCIINNRAIVFFEFGLGQIEMATDVICHWMGCHAYPKPLTPTDALAGRVDEPEPIIEEKFEPNGQQGNPAHHGVTEGRTEGDHQDPNPDAGHLTDRAFVFE